MCLFVIFVSQRSRRNRRFGLAGSPYSGGIRSSQHNQRPMVHSTSYDFSVVTGAFLQDDPETSDKTFDHLVVPRFGLKLESWTLFNDWVQQIKLEEEAQGHAVKVMYLARHGQGVHNWAILKYGQEEWDEHWAMLNGDGKAVWGPDPELTEVGQSQARANNKVWRRQIEDGISLPKRHFVSPFTRALETMRLTWEGIGYNGDIPLVKEDLHEDLGVHTCDKRRTRSYIEHRYNDLVRIEATLSEEDDLWKPDHRETDMEHDVRSSRFLNWLFDNVKEDSICCTSHSGTTNSILRMIGHRPFQLPPGGMIPVIVCARRVSHGTGL